MFTARSDVVGLSFVVTYDIAFGVERISEGRHFTISGLSCEFPEISRVVLCDISKLG
jgi:hypothetical protein